VTCPQVADSGHGQPCQEHITSASSGPAAGGDRQRQQKQDIEPAPVTVHVRLFFFTSAEEGGDVFTSVCLSVCLSVG